MSISKVLLLWVPHYFVFFSFHIVYMLWFVQLCKSVVEKKSMNPPFQNHPLLFVKIPHPPPPTHLTGKLVKHTIGFSSSLFSTCYVMFLLIKYMAILGNVYISLYCREAGKVFCHPFNFFFFLFEHITHLHIKLTKKLKK